MAVWVSTVASTVDGHLPSTSTRLSSRATTAADFQLPRKEFRVESRNEALCALGRWWGEEIGRTGLQIVGYFWKWIL